MFKVGILMEWGKNVNILFVFHHAVNVVIKTEELEEDVILEADNSLATGVV